MVAEGGGLVVVDVELVRDIDAEALIHRLQRNGIIQTRQTVLKCVNSFHVLIKWDFVAVYWGICFSGRK